MAPTVTGTISNRDHGLESAAAKLTRKLWEWRLFPSEGCKNSCKNDGASALRKRPGAIQGPLDCALHSTTAFLSDIFTAVFQSKQPGPFAIRSFLIEHYIAVYKATAAVADVISSKA